METTAANLTRIRIEATGNSDHVIKALMHSFFKSIELDPSEWEEENPGVEIQTTKTGYWGRVTMRKKHGN